MLSPQATAATLVILSTILKGKGGGMAEDIAGNDQRGERRPYVKPFVRNLDAVDTKGGKLPNIFEDATPTPFGASFFGPS